MNLSMTGASIIVLLVVTGVASGTYYPETDCSSWERMCAHWCEKSGKHYGPGFGCNSCGCICSRLCKAMGGHEGGDNHEPKESPSKAPLPTPDSPPQEAPRVTPSPRPTRTPRALPSSSPHAAPSKSPRPSPKGEENPTSGYPSGTGQCEVCSKENFQAVNRYRGQMGAGSLKWNDDLAAKAKAHSKWMFDRKLMEHSTYGGWENIAMR